MTTANARIIAAMLFSMAAHALVLAGHFAPSLAPTAGIRPRKVSVRLLSRQVPAPEAPVKNRVPEARKSDHRALQLPEPVEVAVREIPPFSIPESPVVPDVVSTIPVADDRSAEPAPVAEQAGGELVMARPLYLDNPPPQYPPLARRRGWQGTVMLEVLVSPAGKVVSLRVSESSGREVLDESAMAAVASWRFEPGRKGGNPVEMVVLVPVRFSIK